MFWARRCVPLAGARPTLVAGVEVQREVRGTGARGQNEMLGASMIAPEPSDPRGTGCGAQCCHCFLVVFALLPPVSAAASLFVARRRPAASLRPRPVATPRSTADCMWCLFLSACACLPLLGAQSVLGPVWLAAHHEVQKKLSKPQIMQYNVSEFTDQIQKQDDEDTMALRLSSFLLIGVSRIFSQKVQILLSDCTEAYGRLTLAFKPSNVDMAPISRNAQLKAITDSNLLEDTGITGLEDLDLELDVKDADWAVGSQNVSQSQASLADITLPDVVTQRTDDARQWEDEDPLFYGGDMGGGDNPLDVDYDLDTENLRDDDAMVEEPEVRRDSDGSAMQMGGEGELDVLDPSAMDMPDIDFAAEDVELARESQAHQLSMAADSAGLPTPVRVSGGGLDFDSPAIEAQLPRRAKKGKVNLKKDASTNLDTDKYKSWISNPDSVKDIVRAPRPFPRNRKEAIARRYQNLAKEGRLVETLIMEPLTGHVGKKLTSFFRELGERGHAAVVEREAAAAAEAMAASKKRKSREGDEEEPAQAGADEFSMEMDADVSYGDIHDMPHEGENVPDLRTDDNDHQAAFGDFDEARLSVEEREGMDDGEEAAEVDAEAETGLTQAAVKAIGLLQHQFKIQKTPKGEKNPGPLSYNKIMQPTPEAAPPTRHQATTAFYQLLNLHAKGFVKLDQPEVIYISRLLPSRVLHVVQSSVFVSAQQP